MHKIIGDKLKSITIEYLPSIKVHLEAYSFYEKHTTQRKIDKVIASILIFLGFFLIILTIVITNNFYYLLLSLLFILFGLLEFIGILDIGKFITAIRFKKNPKFKYKQKIIFSDSGLHYKTEGIQSKINWNYYNRFLESKNSYILIFGNRLYSVIPKNAFNTNELKLFKNMIEEKIK